MPTLAEAGRAAGLQAQQLLHHQQLLHLHHQPTTTKAMGLLQLPCAHTTGSCTPISACGLLTLLRCQRHHLLHLVTSSLLPPMLARCQIIGWIPTMILNIPLLHHSRVEPALADDTKLPPAALHTVQVGTRPRCDWPHYEAYHEPAGGDAPATHDPSKLLVFNGPAGPGQPPCKHALRLRLAPLVLAAWLGLSRQCWMTILMACCQMLSRPS